VTCDILVAFGVVLLPPVLRPIRYSNSLSYFRIVLHVAVRLVIVPVPFVLNVKGIKKQHFFIVLSIVQYCVHFLATRVVCQTEHSSRAQPGLLVRINLPNSYFPKAFSIAFE